MEEKIDEGRSQETDWENHVSASLKNMRRRTKETMKDFPTRGFREHMRAARIETLLAFRSVLDAAIEHLEEKSGPEEPKAGRINIE